MKTVVTHISVDLDAVTSSWLVKKYVPGMADADLAFVSAGKTLNDMKPDEDPDIIHVDTGKGQFDHHQFEDKEKKLSATKRVFDFLQGRGYVKQSEVPALSAIVDFVTSIDHFGELFFPDPLNIRYDFAFIDQIFDGLRAQKMDDHEIQAFASKILESILFTVKQKILAEEDIKKGYVFESKWGKTIAMDTKNEAAMKHAMKSGYKVVLRRNPDHGFIRIKTWPEPDIDLTPVYEKVIAKDPKASWYLHPSKHMLLNGSIKRPDSVPSSLGLPQVIEIIRSIS